MGQTDNKQIKLFQMVVSTLRKKPSRVEELVGKVYDHEFIKEAKWTTLRFSFILLFLRVVLKNAMGQEAFKVSKICWEKIVIYENN